MLEEKIENCELCDSRLIENGDVICVEIVLKKHEGKDKFKTFCTSEAIELVKEKYHFIVKYILESTTLTNITEEQRRGKWEFVGYYDINEKEKWLFKNPEAVNSVMKGIEQASKKEFVSLPEAAAKLATKLETVSEEKEAEFDRKINKKISKSTYKRLEIQKKEE